MGFLFNIDFDALIILLSAAAAAVSFAAFVWPYLVRSEKKERYKEVIEKKRKALYEQAREDIASGKFDRQEDKITAAQSMAALYKLQKLAGKASGEARTLMLQAGIRNPSAPLKYLTLRLTLPFMLSGFALLVLKGGDKEVANALILLVCFVSALIGFYLPRLLVKNIADKRKHEISLTFPDALDMLLICVQGGIGIEAAISRIGGTIADSSAVLAEELGILSAELSLLNDRHAAYMGFANRAGSTAAKSFANSMLQAEQYGTSISKAIRVLADESRELRMSTAEQKAASLPPKLTVPMILFFLPPLFVVILGPAFLGS